MTAHDNSGRRRRITMAAGAALIALAVSCGAALASSGPARFAAASPGGSQLPLVRLASVQMTSATTGWGLRFTGNPASRFPVSLVLVRTSDGGRRWTGVAPLPAGSTADLIDAVTGSLAWVVAGTRSHTFVLVTRNGGASWTRSAPLPPGGAVSLSFYGTAHGWLLQSLGAATGSEWVALYRTTDSGLRWSLVAQTPPAPALGTSSSGLPTGCDKAGITFNSARTGWLSGGCADGHLVLVSTDAGSHWTSQAVPLSSSACVDGCSVSPPQFFGRAGFMTVDRGPLTAYLLVSTDGGARWRLRRLPAGAGTYPQIRFFGRRQGIMVPATPQATPGPVFYLTANGGRTWSAVTQGKRFTTPGTSTDFVTTRTGFAWVNDADVLSGGPPDMYETTNSGRTWQAFAPLLG